MSDPRLEQFYKDCLKMGCLKCFRHFSLYLKGREEMVVEVGKVQSCGTESLNQRHTGALLPPASPPGGDLDTGDASAAIYLIGAYAKYKWPYVWLRSRQHLAEGQDLESPLDLHSTRMWKEEGLRVWHIVEELVQHKSGIEIQNPFAVNYTLLEQMPTFEKALQAAALSTFLKDVLSSPCAYSQLLREDMSKCLDIHYDSMAVQFSPSRKDETGTQGIVSG